MSKCALQPDLLDLLATSCVVLASKQVGGSASSTASKALVEKATGLPTTAVDQMEWSIRQVLEHDTAAISTLRCLRLYLERLGGGPSEGGSAAVLGRMRSLVSRRRPVCWVPACAIFRRLLLESHCRPAGGGDAHRHGLPQLPALCDRCGRAVRGAASERHHSLLALELGNANRLPGTWCFVLLWTDLRGRGVDAVLRLQDMSTAELSVAIKAASGRSRSITRPSFPTEHANQTLSPLNLGPPPAPAILPRVTSAEQVLYALRQHTAMPRSGQNEIF